MQNYLALGEEVLYAYDHAIQGKRAVQNQQDGSWAIIIQDMPLLYLYQHQLRIHMTKGLYCDVVSVIWLILTYAYPQGCFC